MAQEIKVFELAEYQPLRLPQDALSYDEGAAIWSDYSKQISVEFPSPATEGQWRLISQGWVGYLPVQEDLAVRLAPKVTLENLFGMLEVAYRLNRFEFLDDLYQCGSLDEFFDSLAKVLAGRILDRCRKGLYCEYQIREERTTFLKGRLDFKQAARSPWEVRLPCVFDEHTADLEENQLLFWTMRCILRSGLCSESTRSLVRGAYRLLNQIVTPKPFRGEDCAGRFYNRLNDDYRSMHALCRFFLESSGAQHEEGDRSVMPFMIDMAALFELYVAEWLSEFGPEAYRYKPQARVHISKGEGIYFDVDLLISHRFTGEPVLVIDTKYKTPTQPSTDDIQQVVAYAEAVGCQEAWLVYPQPVQKGVDLHVGETRVRSVPFDIRGNLEEGGMQFSTMLEGVLEAKVGLVEASAALP